MTNLQTIVVTGGCGFIGLNTVRALLDEPAVSAIRIVDNLSNSDRAGLEGVLKSAGRVIGNDADRWRVEIGKRQCVIELTVDDIRSPETARAATACAQAVVHLAAQTGVLQSIEHPMDDVDQNIRGTMNYLEAARANGIERVIAASSLGVVGDSVQPQTEESLVRPYSPYTAGKAAVEAYCSAYTKSFGLKVAALRFANVYGPFAWRKGSVVAAFVKRALSGAPLIVDGDGHQTRDFVYAPDLAKVIAAAALGQVDDKLWGHPLNVASGAQTAVVEMAAAVQRELAERGVTVGLQHGPARSADLRLSAPSIARLSALLPGISMRPLTDGLPATIDWFMSTRPDAGQGRPGELAKPAYST